MVELEFWLHDLCSQLTMPLSWQWNRAWNWEIFLSLWRRLFQSQGMVYTLLTQTSKSIHFLHHMHLLSLHMWMTMKVVKKYMVKGIREQAVWWCAAWVQIQFLHLLASLKPCFLKCEMRKKNNNLKRLLKGTNQLLRVKSLTQYLT